MTDHKKYISSPGSYYNIRRISDSLCKEYGLSVIKEPKEPGKSYYETLVSKEQKSWKELLRQNIDRCMHLHLSIVRILEVTLEEVPIPDFGEHIRKP